MKKYKFSMIQKPNLSKRIIGSIVFLVTLIFFPIIFLILYIINFKKFSLKYILYRYKIEALDMLKGKW